MALIIISVVSCFIASLYGASLQTLVIMAVVSIAVGQAMPDKVLEILDTFALFFFLIGVAALLLLVASV